MDFDTKAAKRGNKKQKNKEDPIIIKKIKPNSHSINIEIDKPVKISHIRAKKDADKDEFAYDKFMQLFKQSDKKDIKEKEKYADKLTKIIKTNTKMLKISLPHVSLSNIPKPSRFNEHLNFKWEDLVSQKLLPAKDKKENSSSETKAYSFDWDDDENYIKLKNEEAILQNRVEIKQYKLKDEEKTKQSSYQDQDGRVWIMNKYLDDQAKNSPNFFSNTIETASKLHNIDTINNQECFTRGIMLSYADLIYSDPNEDKCLEVKIILNYFLTRI